MEPSLVTQQHLETIRAVLTAIGKHIDAHPHPGFRDSVRAAVSAQCVKCGILLTGEELIAGPDDRQAAHAKSARLQQGYCARRGCDSYYYQLIFMPCAETNWPTIVDEAAAGMLGESEFAPAPSPRRPTGYWRPILGFGAALLLGALLLFFKQYYRGGTIPWIREPENFQVDQIASTKPDPGPKRAPTPAPLP